MADTADLIVLDASRPVVAAFALSPATRSKPDPGRLRWRRLGDARADDPAFARRLSGCLPDPGRAQPAPLGLVVLPEDQILRLPPETARDERERLRATHLFFPAGAARPSGAVSWETLQEAGTFLCALGLTPRGVAVQDAAGALAVLPEAAAAQLPALPPLPTEGAVPEPPAARARAVAAAHKRPDPARAEPDLWDDADEDPAFAARRARVAEALIRKAASAGRIAGTRWALRGLAMTGALAAALVITALRAPAPLPQTPPLEIAAVPEAGVSAGAPDDGGATIIEPVRPGASQPDIKAHPPGATRTRTGPDLAGTLFTPPRDLAAGAASDEVGALIQPGLDRTARIDATALPTPAGGMRDADLPDLPTLAPPAAAGLAVATDARGFVLPTAEGVAAPGGYRVVAGTPDEAPPPRPERSEADLPLRVVSDREALPEDDPLRRLDPRPRPVTLVARNERAQLGGKTRAELAYLRPPWRPASAQDTALATAPSADATRLAHARSPRPDLRSADALSRHAAARSAAPAAARPAAPAAAPPAQVVEAAAVASPAAATPDNVQAEAAASGQIDLGELNLLGTYGRTGAPKALVRLPSGRVVNVSVGDQMDGGRVAAIGDGRLDYRKGGQTRRLTMPRL